MELDMARGKYANTADARRAREDAIREAQRKASEADRLRALVGEHETTIATLRAEVAAGVSADLRREREKSARLEQELRAAKALLHDVRAAMQDTYEKAVQQFVKRGVPHNVACDNMDAVTTFLVGDELLTAAAVEVDWVKGPKVRNIRKRRSARAKAYATADRIDRLKADAGNRAELRMEQGIQ